MTQDVVLIGGPWDGQRVAAPPYARFVNLLVPTLESVGECGIDPLGNATESVTYQVDWSGQYHPISDRKALVGLAPGLAIKRCRATVDRLDEGVVASLIRALGPVLGAPIWSACRSHEPGWYQVDVVAPAEWADRQRMD